MRNNSSKLNIVASGAMQTWSRWHSLRQLARYSTSCQDDINDLYSDSDSTLTVWTLL